VDSPILYVIAGPNGIGKTTSTYSLVPKNVPVINSDEIARIVKTAGIIQGNTQEYANREALKLMQEYLEKHISFGFETNLCDNDTWKFLLEIQKSGYQIQLIFLSTDDLKMLNTRIEERHKRGEHFVTPSVVEERYVNGLNLLQHYFEKPDKVVLIDNSAETLMVAERINNKTRILLTPIPAWAQKCLSGTANISNRPASVKDLSSADEVKRFYGSLSKGKEENREG